MRHTPPDGENSIKVPCIRGHQCRLKVELQTKGATPIQLPFAPFQFGAEHLEMILLQGLDQARDIGGFT